jgi:nitric oxide reductase subunit B
MRSLILLMVSASRFSFTWRPAPTETHRRFRRASWTRGALLFTAADITAGQQIFLSHGLMENGSIWGHGAYLGPDFSAEYLHTMALDVRAAISTRISPNAGADRPRDLGELGAEVAHILKENR